MNDARIESLLRATAANLDWPPTPLPILPRQSLSAPVAVTRRTWWRPVAIALAALLLLTATAAAVPGIREPVLDWLGLRSVHIERVPRALPERAPGATLGLGRRTTLADARARLEFAPVLPTGLGTPTVYHEGFPPGGQLALVYRDGRLLLTEVQGKLDRRYLAKFLAAGTGVHGLRVGGQQALWIDGELHQYVFADRTGEIRTDSVRTAGNVLLWRRGPLLLRLEGARTRAEALRIARSLRAAP